MSLDGFAEVYARLNSIEKDLAFAEISKDEIKLKELEEEKIKVLKSLEKLLSSIGLKIEDLSPKYACEKCLDTGYVGTHRCECYSLKV